MLRQVYGSTNGTSVTVAVTGSGCPSLSGVKATIFNHSWTAKVPGARGGDCMIVATDDQGNTANISHVTYGDVWCMHSSFLLLCPQSEQRY